MEEIYKSTERLNGFEAQKHFIRLYETVYIVYRESSAGSLGVAVIGI